MYSRPIAQIRACAAAVSAGRQMQIVPEVALARLSHGSGAIRGSLGSPILPAGDGRAREVCGGPWLPRRFPRMLCRGAKLCFCSVLVHYILSQAHGLVLKEALRSAWLQWASHGGLTACFSHGAYKSLACSALAWS